MKNITTILAVILAATTITTFSCTRDDDSTNEGNQQQQEEQKPEHPKGLYLGETTWESHENSTWQYSGYDFGVEFNFIVDFIDSLNCEMFFDFTITYPEELGGQEQNNNDDMRYVYYFDGEHVYVHEPDDYGEYVADDQAMTFNAADTTFTMPVGDPEIEEILGLDVITFHLTHGTFELK